MPFGNDDIEYEQTKNYVRQFYSIKSTTLSTLQSIIYDIVNVRKTTSIKFPIKKY